MDTHYCFNSEESLVCITSTWSTHRSFSLLILDQTWDLNQSQESSFSILRRVLGCLHHQCLINCISRDTWKQWAFSLFTEVSFSCSNTCVLTFRSTSCTFPFLLLSFSWDDQIHIFHGNQKSRMALCHIYWIIFEGRLSSALQPWAHATHLAELLQPLLPLSFTLWR